MTTFIKNIEVNAPKEKVWEAIANLGDIYKFNPNVSNSYYTGELSEGVGAKRVCELYPAGKVVETAIKWEEGQSLKLNVEPIEKAPPFKCFNAEIKLSENGTTTAVAFHADYDMKLGVVGNLLNKILIKSKIGRSH